MGRVQCVPYEQKDFDSYYTDANTGNIENQLMVVNGEEVYNMSTSRIYTDGNNAPEVVASVGGQATDAVYFDNSGTVSFTSVDNSGAFTIAASASNPQPIEIPAGYEFYYDHANLLLANDTVTGPAYLIYDAAAGKYFECDANGSYSYNNRSFDLNVIHNGHSVFRTR